MEVSQKIEVEFIDQKEFGIQINHEDQSYFLPCKRDKIEKWVFKNLEEDHNYQWVEDWSGGFATMVPEIIEDTWEESLREYALENMKRWQKQN